MASVTIKVRYVATGDFSQLHAQIKGLGAAATGVSKANAALATTAKVAKGTALATGGIADASIRTVGPLGMMLKAIERNRMTLSTLIKTMRASKAIIHEHNMALNAMKTSQLSAAGGGKVLMQSQMGIISATKIMATQFRMLNTLMMAFGSTMIRVGKQIQWAGRQIMVGIGIPLAILGTAANRAAEGYSREMTRVIKVTNFTVDSTSKAFRLQEESVMRQVSAIRSLGASMGFLAEETTRTVAEFAQMGFVGSALNQMADAALRLSFTAGAELDTSIQLTRVAAQAFGVDLDKLTETFARLNLVENNTALSLAELAGALPVVAGVANAVGLSIEQTSGFLAMMKENGISANEGATALRTGLIRIVQEGTEPARKAFANIGLDLDGMKDRMNEANGDVMIFFNELGERLKELEGNQAAMNDFTAAIGKLTGTRQAARFITFLKEIPNAMKAVETGQSVMEEAIANGVDYVTALNQAKDAMGEMVGDSVGARAFIGVWTESTAALAQYNREQDKIAKSAAGIAKRLRAELNVELSKIGEITLGVANRFREMMLSVLKSFNALSQGQKKLIVGLSVFALGLGAVIMSLGLFLNMFGNITTAIFSIFPRLTGSHQLMTAQMRAEVASYNTLTTAIQASNAAKKQQIALNTSVVASSSGAAAANAAQAGALAMQPTTRRQSKPATTGLIKKPGSLVRRDAFKKIGVAITMLLTGPMKALRAAFGALTTFATKGLGSLAKAFPVLGKAMLGFRVVAVAVFKAIRVAMMGTGIIGLVLIITMIIAAMMDWKSTVDGFKSTAMPAFERLKDILLGLWELVKGLFSSFSSESEAISSSATTFGEAVGKVFTVLVALFEAIVNTFWPIISRIVSGVKDLFDFVLKIMAGDLRGAMESLGSAILNIGSGIIQWILYPLRLVLEVIAKMPNKMGEFAQSALDSLEALRLIDGSASDAAAAAGFLAKNMREVKALSDATEKRIDEINNQYQESLDIVQELIDEQIISQDYDLEKLKTSELITDEQYEHLVNVKEYPVVLAVANGLLDKQLNLNRQIESTIRMMGSSSALERFRLSEQLDILKAQAAALAKNDTSVNEAIAAVKKLYRSARDVRDTFSHTVDEVEEVNEELERAVKQAMDLQRALRSSVSDIMGKLKSAVSNIVKAQQDAITGFYSKISSATSDYFSTFRDGIEENFKLIEESIEHQYNLEKERIESIEKQELDRLDAIEKEMDKQERIREKFFAAEKSRIDFLSGKQISSLQIAEALAKGDISGAAILRIQQEAAEGNFVSELMQREEQNLKELQKEQRDAQRDAARSQAQVAIEELDLRREVSIQSLEEAKRSYELQTKAAEEAAEAAINAATEAAEVAREEEEIRIRNYLEEWEKVTPATEAEYQKHLKKLQNFLDQSGARLNNRINEINSDLQRQLSNISKGFENENSAIMSQLTSALNQSGLAAETALTGLKNFASNTFNEVIKANSLFVSEFSKGLVSSKNLYENFLKEYQKDMFQGFRAARDSAIAVLKEEQKWEDAGRAIQEALRRGAAGSGGGGGGGSTDDFPLLREGASGDFVSRLQAALNKGGAGLKVDGKFGPLTATAVKNFQRARGLAVDGIVGKNTWSKLQQVGWLHKGGIVGQAMAAASMNKPLKSDEMMAVLQKGEYVIQKSAVKSIGTGILEKINNAKRSFSPAPNAGFSMSRDNSSSGEGGSESNYHLAFHINGGNIDEAVLAKKVMFEIDKANRNSGAGRRVVSSI